ncbi:MAG TPA: DUF5709 domain-containing protein [Segeticoccus sp.]|nr:DUF5709 domain-containing protein [Segeticoccus sp.]
MTDHESTGAESMGSYSLDDETQLSEQDSLVDRGLEDPLDEGYSPPERPRGVDSYGTTVEEQEDRETIDQRISQEEPDPETAYGAPDDEGGLEEEQDRVGGDDPDSIAAEDDFLGDDEVGDERSGRLMAPDEGTHEDEQKDLVAEDVGISGGAASSEEAAMHTVDVAEADEAGLGRDVEEGDAQEGEAGLAD